MTSTQSMDTGRAFAARTAVRVPALLIAFVALGCGTGRPAMPLELHAPYREAALWGVAPFTNESGVSVIDGAAVADAFATQVQQTHGLNAVPVNRVIAAMREHDLSAVSTAAEARALMRTLDLDGLIVGTVTRYDPYRPPVLGAAVQLYAAHHATAGRRIDPQTIGRETRGQIAMGTINDATATAQAAGVFDARNAVTEAQLAAYAAGRVEPDSAYGPDAYLVNMDLYTEFVAYRLLRDLLHAEHARIGPGQHPAPSR